MTPLMQSRERRGSSTSLVLRPAPLHPPTSPSSIEPLQVGEPPSPTRFEICIHWCSSITRPAACARDWTERRPSHAEATRTHLDFWHKSYVGGYMRATSPRVLHTCLTPSPGCHPASFFTTETTSATRVIFMPRWGRPITCPCTRYRTLGMVVMDIRGGETVVASQFVMVVHLLHHDCGSSWAAMLGIHPRSTFKYLKTTPLCGQ